MPPARSRRLARGQGVGCGRNRPVPAAHPYLHPSSASSGTPRSLSIGGRVMFPIVPFLAWAGGIAAGAQVAGGVVRAVGKLADSRPDRALAELTDGLLSPVRSVAEQVGSLAGDVVQVVLGEPEPEVPALPG